MLYKGVKTNLSPFFIAGVLSLFLILSALRVSGCSDNPRNVPEPAMSSDNIAFQKQPAPESKCDIYTLDASRTKIASNLKPPVIGIPDRNQVIVSTEGSIKYIDDEYTLHFISGNAELRCPNYH